MSVGSPVRAGATEALLRRRAREAGCVEALRDVGLEATGEVPSRALLAARLGASERLRDLTVRRLRGRSSGDGPLLRRSLLRAQIAGATTEQLEIQVLAEQHPDDAHELDALHRRLTRVDRALLRCYGAEGFLAGGVGEDALQGERAADRARDPRPARGGEDRSAPGRRPTAAQEEPELEALRSLAREWGQEMATRAGALDAEPALAATLTELAGPAWFATAGVPREHGGVPLRVGGRDVDGTRALDRVVVLEELARGDVGVLLASPGPSMSGVLVERIADDDQKARYYERILARPTWTCFALTEPDHGSDATGLRTRAARAPDGALSLVGAKRFVGNAARADLAVVFARRAPGPLGIGAYLVESAAPRFAAAPLPTLGLRGAEICSIDLDRVTITADDELGRRRRATARGLRGALAVLDRLRPGVAAMAVGVAACALDVLDTAWPAPPPGVAERAVRWRRDLGAVRALTTEAARVVDATGDGHLGSLAKARACLLAEEVTLGVAELLGPGARATTPGLERAILAARGLEFMEGTRNVQLLNGFRGIDTGRLGAP